MRWLALRFFTTTIWKQVAEPWREAMVEYARNSSQIYVGVSTHIGKEHDACVTYSEPSLAVRSLDLLRVSEPVSVPPPEGTRVMDTNGIDTVPSELVSLTK